ncbi:MAG: hypothetical protein AAF653_20835, partial [Chloroflexota bacterium]
MQNDQSDIERLIQILAELPQATQIAIAVAVGAVGVKILEDRVDKMMGLKDRESPAQATAQTGSSSDLAQIAALIQVLSTLSTPQMDSRAAEIQRQTEEHAVLIQSMAQTINEIK